MPAASYGSSESSVSITSASTSSTFKERLIFFVMSSSSRSLSVTLKPAAGAVVFVISSAISGEL